jgi:hypothetical protein
MPSLKDSLLAGYDTPRRSRSYILWIFVWILAVFALGVAFLPDDQPTYWRNVSFLAFLPPAGFLGLRMGLARGRRR